MGQALGLIIVADAADAPRQMGSRGRLGRAHIGAHPGDDARPRADPPGTHLPRRFWVIPERSR